ncbi:hypothetical protein J4732_06035 [Serratia marcescens]|uniref:Uncharacterized protein n=1 Tax=Serratia marcescens TaxID=615 RepID=A0A939SR10_SERMA|nr:hypothetical protein [Serratia marcescens]
MPACTAGGGAIERIARLIAVRQQLPAVRRGLHSADCRTAEPLLAALVHLIVQLARKVSLLAAFVENLLP